MKTKFSLLAAIFAASCSTSIFALEQNRSIETISVMGSRAPVDKSTLAGSVSFINADIIEASGAATVTDLLRSFASINISQSGPTGTLTEIRFRGSESNHILVLVDGVEINDIGQGGLVNFAHLLVSDIERIELLRGPQSALWGSSAVSGVISITSKKAAISGQHKLSANVGLGTQATRQLSVSYKTRRNGLSLSANLHHLKTDGENVSRQGSEEEGYRNTSFNTNVAYQANREHTLVFNLRLVDFVTDFDAIDFVNTGLPADADNYSKGKQLSALLRWDFTPSAGIWSQSLSYQLNRFASDSFSSDVFSGGTVGKTQRLNWINYIDLGANDFINVGLDSVIEDFEQSGPIVFGDPNQTQDNQTISVLSDGQYEVAKNLYASYSARADQSDEFDDANSFRLGLSYNFTDQLKVFVSRGKAVKNPSFTERFGFFPGTFTGNSGLLPESSYANEIGLIYNLSSRFSAELTHFDTQLENEINGFVFDPATSAFTAQNIDETSTRRGLEFSLYGDWKDITWSANYAYLEAKAPTEVELRRARHSGSTTINYALNKKSNLYFQADYTGSKQDRFFPPFPNSSEIVGLSPYWLVSANYQYKYNNSLSFGLRVDNLLNEDFEDVFGFVGQSRKIVVNMRYQLN
ncbi:TonB-dependent siderophore receptor [Glaciecola sp. 33A]|uniref:TonB-dependent receptor plug domain-containing protein n=1 Tax=Glaciecola sp. 33A TaxID=2057807 RepID=UPI000C336604|nr:TonB-dependent receptor [Glaciecola sp. 33A]PKI00908.1 TonB-dependent receptor [Glaciecola sp. 33A]